MSTKSQEDKLKPGYPWTARQKRLAQPRKYRKQGLNRVKKG